jgi:hypothetical protein
MRHFSCWENVYSTISINESLDITPGPFKYFKTMLRGAGVDVMIAIFGEKVGVFLKKQ